MQISVLKFSDLEKIYILAVLKYLTSLKRFISQLLGQMMVMYLTTNAAISVIVQMRRCCFSSENFVSDFCRLLEGGLHYACYILTDIQGSFCGMVIIITKLNKPFFPIGNTSRLWAQIGVSLTHFGCFKQWMYFKYVCVLFTRYSLVYRLHKGECGLHLTRIFFTSNTRPK